MSQIRAHKKAQQGKGKVGEKCSSPDRRNWELSGGRDGDDFASLQGTIIDAPGLEFFAADVAWLNASSIFTVSAKIKERAN